MGRYGRKRKNTALRRCVVWGLLATAAGYVYREEGLIAVKTLLNVRGGVDFHTGNRSVYITDLRCVPGSWSTRW